MANRLTCNRTCFSGGLLLKFGGVEVVYVSKSSTTPRIRHKFRVLGSFKFYSVYKFYTSTASLLFALKHLAHGTPVASSTV
jgi:hypothetical protein